MAQRAKTLVTGGTGFIGSHLVRELARRGDELRLLIREGREAPHLAGFEFERADGDVCDRSAVRRAMEGVERVFHVAGKTSMRRGDRRRVFEVNVGGTENVMEEALRAGVVRAVLTSSVGAIGPAAPGGTADESQPFTAGALGIAYINSKHEAELAAMRVAARGLPVVVVNPSFVLGPDDPTGTSNELVRRLLLRRVPAYLDGGLNIVDVRDVALGHLQADERGREGDRYALTGRNFTLQRLFADLSRIAGVPPPPARVPGGPMLAAIESLERLGLPTPASSDEVRSGMQWWTYRNDKAVTELGFAPRPHEETLEDTVRWQLERLGDHAGGHRLSDAALRGAGLAWRLPSRLLPFGVK
ncbi:MAG: NAD-dependent epimerase/dehydratase family protein [Actinomycetota bacterium]|nr:NAD-dependent epimerase/dehydratase family protein [Actinomycetota bacterium]